VRERSTSYHWADDDPPWAWLQGAACSGSRVEVFFPVKGESYAEARSICARCPVLAECRSEIDRVEARLRGPDVQGFYAGETPSERRRRRTIADGSVDVDPPAPRERSLAGPVAAFR
jgi:hypothetical protein